MGLSSRSIEGFWSQDWASDFRRKGLRVVDFRHAAGYTAEARAFRAFGLGVCGLLMQGFRIFGDIVEDLWFCVWAAGNKTTIKHPQPQP